MGDWQVNDLALCVKQGPWRIIRAGDWSTTPQPQPGRKYTVRKVGKYAEGDFLGFAETGYDYYRREFFVRITPPEADQFDREVIELLNRTPVHSDLSTITDRAQALDGWC